MTHSEHATHVETDALSIAQRLIHPCRTHFYQEYIETFSQEEARAANVYAPRGPLTLLFSREYAQVFHETIATIPSYSTVDLFINEALQFYDWSFENVIMSKLRASPHHRALLDYRSGYDVISMFTLSAQQSELARTQFKTYIEDISFASGTLLVWLSLYNLLIPVVDTYTKFFETHDLFFATDDVYPYTLKALELTVKTDVIISSYTALEKVYPALQHVDTPWKWIAPLYAHQICDTIACPDNMKQLFQHFLPKLREEFHNNPSLDF